MILLFTVTVPILHLTPSTSCKGPWPRQRTGARHGASSAACPSRAHDGRNRHAPTPGARRAATTSTSLDRTTRELVTVFGVRTRRRRTRAPFRRGGTLALGPPPAVETMQCKCATARAPRTEPVLYPVEVERREQPAQLLEVQFSTPPKL
jgi:hypothetical protein